MTMLQNAMLKIADRLRASAKYRFLLGELVVREIKIKYKRSVLGILWSVLSPLMMMEIMNFVFSHLFHASIHNFIIYYLCGFLFYQFMQEATGGGLQAIIGNVGLISKVYVPKYIFPTAKMTVALVNLGFALIPFIAISALTGVQASWGLLLLPFVFLMLVMFVLGLTFIFATVTVFFRDVIHFHQILMMAWMYLTPIFYPASIIPARFRLIIDANPLYLYVKTFRIIVLEHSFPTELRLLGCFIVGAVTLAVGYAIFRSNENRFALHF